MSLSQMLLRPADETYAERLLAIAPSNLIGYWKLDEASGTTANDSSGNGRTGTISGATLGQPGIGDGLTAISFDGVNDYINLYSASLAAAWNGDELTISVWFKVSDVGVWTDGAYRAFLCFLANGTNYDLLYRTPTNNQIIFDIKATGSQSLTTTSLGGVTTWIHYAMTRSKVADAVKHYINGTQSGATLNTLTSWSGALSATETLIGARNTGGSQPWSGLVAHVALWNSVLTPAQIASLGAV